MIGYELDDFRRGDIIKIVLLDDPFLNVDYKGKEGEITKIDYGRGVINGTWGKLDLYPEYDDIEIVKPINNDLR